MNPIAMLRNMFGTMFGNPEQMVRQMVGNNPNPMIKNLISMAEKGDSKGLENFAQNVCKEKNINYQAKVEEFNKQIKNEGGN